MDLKQLSASQNVAWKQFDEAVNDCKLCTSDPTYLLYWLIVCDFNLVKAEKMLRKSLEWRRQYRIDSILKDYKPKEVVTKYVSIKCIGQDKQLSPVWIHRFGKMDLDGILRAVKKKDYHMHIIWLTERILSEIFKNPTKYRHSPDVLIQSTFIVDMEGFSMIQIASKRVRDMIIQMVPLIESNYPELYRRIIIINAPNVFNIAFNLIRPLLNQRSKSKISVFNHDEELWKEALLAEVDPEQLPACYGGTLTDPDGNPNCVTMINMGGEVPKSYFFNKFETIDKKLLVIRNGSKELLDFVIDRAGTILKWNFHSEDSDIDFAVYRRKGKDLVPTVPHDRVDCQIAEEEGEVRCDECGVYAVEFDNTFSYLRSKKIWYSISFEYQTRSRELESSAG